MVNYELRTQQPAVWVLADFEGEALEPPGLDRESDNFFVVHSTSPHPKRFLQWSNSRNPVTVGLPLWTPDLIRLGKSLPVISWYQIG